MIKFDDILAFVEEYPEHPLATSWGEMLEDCEGALGYDTGYYSPEEWLDEAEAFTIMSDREWQAYLDWRIEKGGWPKLLPGRTREWPNDQ